MVDAEGTFTDYYRLGSTERITTDSPEAPAQNPEPHQ